MTPLRILVANEDEATLTSLARVVTEMGHEVVEYTTDVALIADLTARNRPDVVLLSVGPSGSHALAMIDQVVKESACAVVALLHTPDAEFVSDACRRGVFGVIIDRDPSEWQSTLDVARCRFKQYADLRAAFARREAIERAKGILMERHSLAADDAHAILRDHARNGNLKLVDVAAAVLDGHLLVPSRLRPTTGI